MVAREVARVLSYELIDKGFTVHRYNAYSTKSIYLKVDGGLCRSIRISDHTGKGYLRYTYNLLSTVKEPYSEKDDGVVRYYYPYDDWNRVVEQIVAYREDLIERYGSSWYRKEAKKVGDKNSRGFWSGAYLVKKK